MLTRQELQDLIGVVADINMIGNLLSQTITVNEIQDELSLDDMKPTGALSELLKRVENNIIIDQDKFERLLEIADQDIDKNSRFASLFETVSVLARTLKDRVLPLLL